MELIEVVLIISYVFISLLALKMFGVSILILYIAQALIVLIALLTLDESFKEFLRFNLASYMALICGCLIFSRSKASGYKPRSTDRKSHRYAFISVVMFVILASAYHYSVIGLPLFSDNLDIARFTAKSGFFELPSRVAIYAPLFLLTLLLSATNSLLFSKREFIFFLIIIVTSISVQGNKSSIFQIIAVFVVVYGFLQEAEHLKNIAFALVGVACAFTIYIFFNLDSLAELELTTYLFDRFGVILFFPGNILYGAELQPVLLFNSAILNDLFQPIATLFGVPTETLNLQLSREIYGRPSGFTVPVTPGLFSYHSFIFGNYISLLISFVIGGIVAFLRNRIHKSSLLGFATICFLQYWIYVGFVSGNIYYLILNLLVPLIMVVFLYQTIRFFLVPFLSNITKL